MEIKDILFQRRKELNMTMKQVANKVAGMEQKAVGALQFSLQF